VTLQFGASLTDDTRSVNYDHNTFIIQATVVPINIAHRLPCHIPDDLRSEDTGDGGSSDEHSGTQGLDNLALEK
jgi:hypothetical protein